MKFTKINKTKARRLFNDGQKIYMLPCKVNERALYDKNSWIKPCVLEEKFSSEEMFNFDDYVNSFEYYNCNTELGKYAHYYIEEE